MELEEFEEYTSKREIEENLLKKIVTVPKEAFRFIADHQYEKHMVQLLVLAGMANGLDKAVEKTIEGNSGIVSVIIYTIIGGLFGWIGYYIFSGILSLAGRWLGGEGRTNTILPVISYAAIPTIATTPLLIVRYAIGFEPIVFNIKFVVYYLVLFIEIALSFWALALLVIGLAQVQRFSIGKAILNILLPILIIFVPILIYFFATSTIS